MNLECEITAGSPVKIGVGPVVKVILAAFHVGSSDEKLLLPEFG